MSSALALLREPPRIHYDQHWLAVGTRIEMEHTRSRAAARIIAMHHLAEHPLYYEELVKMERALARRPAGALAANDGSLVGELWGVLSVASAGASAYHGYKRNQSVGWAIWWGACGALFPIVTPAIAFAQGFGQRAA